MEEKKERKKRTTRKKPEVQEQLIESSIEVYVIDERTGNCVVILSNVDIPQRDDHILLYKDGYGFEMLVTKRFLIVNGESSNIGWNVYVTPIGQPFEVQSSDDIVEKGKTKDKFAN